jgi:futalosine hydrolase
MSTGAAVLVVVASAVEARAVLAGLGQVEGVAGWGGGWEPSAIGGVAGVYVCVSGVGKAAACGATAHALGVLLRQGVAAGGVAVMNVGVCGVLDLEGHGAIGRVVVGGRAVTGDEGVRSERGFTSMAELGFGAAVAGDWVTADAGLVEAVGGGVGGLGGEPGPDINATIATVSTCSGTDGLAREVAVRTGARYEAMEGFGVGLACERLGARFIELRVVSNTCGERARQRWDMALALRRLGLAVDAGARAVLARRA